MEYIGGRDLPGLVSPDTARSVCDMHKDAVIETVLDLFFDAYACGVEQRGMWSRNAILRPPKRSRGTEYCASLECPLHLEADCEDLQVVGIDFEMVIFREPDSKWCQGSGRREGIDKAKPTYLKRWLECIM